MDWLQHLRQGPADPELMARIFPWAAAMIGCPHDAVYHSEGDPWVHTVMVAAELEKSEGFRDLPGERQEALRIAAWFHDVAKPMTTIVEWDEELKRERVRQPGHAPLGAKIAWAALIDAGYDVGLARDVHAMVYWHQRPGHMPDQKNRLLRTIEYGHEVRHTNWDDLLRLCRADQDGRICLTTSASDDNLELLRMHMEDEAVNIQKDLTREPWPFATNAARMKYLNSTDENASPYFTPQEPAGSRVILMSGMPGAGKDTAIARHYGHLPVISLDGIRKEMGIGPRDAQGQVTKVATDRAREYLRRGDDFVWNSTGLTQLTRGKMTRLVLDYDGILEGVSLDVPLPLILRRNRGREACLPEAAMMHLEQKREPIRASEVHELWSINAEGERIAVFGQTPPGRLADPAPDL